MTLATPIASQANAPQHSVVEKVWALLESLTDPEIPVVTLRELGILRDVRLATNNHDSKDSESSAPPTAAAPPWAKLKTMCATC
jgi:ring-1,2-phenylacetyl-CoA epoxidase subunit PaaD